MVPSLDQLEDLKSSGGHFINANGTEQEYKYEGTHPIYGNSIVMKGAPMTIASFGEISQNYKPEYDDETRRFTFTNRETGEVEFEAIERNGIFPITPVPAQPVIMAAIKASRGPKIVQELHERLLHCNVQDMKKAIKAGHYGDVLKGYEPTPDDWEDVEDCITCKMFKDGRVKHQERGAEYARKRTRRVESDDEDEKVEYSLKSRVECSIHFDLVYVGDEISCFMCVGPHNYVKHEWMKSRSADELLTTLLYMVKHIKATNGIERVKWISVDRETSIPAIERKLVVALETVLRQPVPYSHERKVERSVRTMRNRFRTTLGDMVVPVTRQLAKLAWEHVVKASNFIPNTNSGGFLPIQIQNGLSKYRTPPKFGQFVIAPVGKIEGKDGIRRQVAMIVGFEEQTRAVRVKFKGNKEAFPRDSYSVINNQDKGRIRFMEADYEDEEDILTESQVQELVRRIDNTDLDELIGGEVDMDNAAQRINSVNMDLEKQVSSNENESVNEEEEDESEDEEEDVDENPRRSGRSIKSTRKPDFIYAAIKRIVEKHKHREDATTSKLHVVCALVDEAAIKGEEGKKAAAKLELEQVWKLKGAIEPVKLSKEQITNKIDIIKSKLFVIEKQDASNNFVKNKARLVARGDLRKDKPTTTQETFSPTGSFPTFMTLLNIILLNKLSFMTADVETAYLNAIFDGTVFMKLEPNVAALMVELDPKAKDFLEENGSMYVRIVKALYGLQESAKLWYNTLSEALIKIGYQQSSYDQALFFKRNGEEVSFVFVYVDDMLFAGREGEVIKTRDQLKEIFKMKSSEINPKEFDYLGMKIKFDKKNCAFRMSQPGMVKDVTDGITGTSELPCDQNLYVEKDTSSFKNVTSYRSELMKMSYLSKTRPDIKVALSYLATKMQEPTVTDWDKVNRVRKYLNGTRDFEMCVQPMDEIQVYASADASFGPHKDGKSHTGMVITVGSPNAPVIAKSSKQKSVANSSTAAELIAFSSTLEEVLWMVELLNELGINQRAVDIEQDNQSTMRLIEKGPSSTGRTKWLNIKYFWVNEHLRNGRFNVKYVPSLQLLADGLTKPLGRKAFLMWRARILNNLPVPDVSQDEM